MFFRSAILICCAAGMLVAAEVTPQLSQPALGKLSPGQFQPMLFRALETRPPKMSLELGQLSKWQQHDCAIPLLETKVEDPKKYSMPHAPVVGGVVDAIGVKPPVNVCPAWNAAK